VKRSDKKQPELIDGKTGEPAPPPRRIDLSNLRDVRIEMAYVYREMDAGRIVAADASRRVYVLGEIGKIITVAEIERRIGELEERHGRGNASEAQTQQLRH
jgi:hypothetical protein